MKKKIIFLVLLIVMIMFSNNLIINAQSSTNVAPNKINFNYEDSYESFIEKINEESNINVIMKFKSIENMSDFILPYEFENIYVSSSSPYLAFNIYGKNKFLEQYSYINICINAEYVEYVNIFEVVNEAYIDESGNSVNSNMYGWDQVLKDIGLDFDVAPTFDSIKIGMIDAGIVDTSCSYFSNVNIITHIYHKEVEEDEEDLNEKAKARNHASAVCCLINEVTKNISNKEFYSGQINHTYFSQSIIYLLNQFNDAGVKIINLSWGMNHAGTDNYKRLDELFDYYASKYNMIFIKSSGNKNQSYVTSPGYGKNIITVGGIDSKWELYNDSNYSANYMKPLVVAPGENISGIESDNVIYDNNNLKSSTGTSYSAAITTGIVALLYLEFPNIFDKVENVIAALSAGAVKLNKSNDSFETKSGFGLINYSNIKNILQNNGSFYHKSLTTEPIIQEFLISSNTCKDLIIATKACTTEKTDEVIWNETNDFKGNGDEEISYIEQDANNYIHVPKIQIKVYKNDELIFDFENTENIIYTKINNLFECEQYYRLEVYPLEDTTVPVSIMFRDYGSYELREFQSYHKWESDYDLIQHTHDYDSQNVNCNDCSYSKEQVENIITDPNENMGCGTEVTLNNGEYGGYEITQGFTRILYLQGDDILSLSRLDYNWTSSNENAAIVSSYGTVTALSVSEPTWITIIATYKYNNEIIYHKDLLIVPDTSEEFKIYTYDVTMSVEDSYVFKMSYDKSPTISMFDYVWKIPCQKDESAGVQISQWGTITALAPGEMFIEGWSKYNPYIVIQINVVVI